MHLTVNKESPSFWRLHFKGHLQVLLDGEPVAHAVEADDVEGYVVVTRCVNGRPVIEGDRFATDRRDGIVTFRGERREGVRRRPRLERGIA